MSTAVITGIAGQDGSYLAEALLSDGWQVHGVVRRHANGPDTTRLSPILGHPDLTLHVGDVTDPGFIHRLAARLRPDRWFNLAAMSHVGQSFQEPSATFAVNAQAVVTQLEALRTHSLHTRFYQASTSELFGLTRCPPTGFTEAHPFHPRSPYGVAKLAAFWAVVQAREAWGLHASNGILFNHSSPRRGLDFATRVITRGVAEVVAGHRQTLPMGDLSAHRDEGHAADYMVAARKMMEQPEGGDFVVATGEGATIRQMLDHVCGRVGLDPEQVYEPDPERMRPSEVPFLRGDATRAREVLGWRPQRGWREVLDEMLVHDLRLLGQSPEVFGLA